MPMCPKPPGADDHCLGARVEHGYRLSYGVVGGETRVGQSSDVLGLQNGIELHDRAGVCLHEVSEAAVPREAGELAVLATHVVPGPARPAQPARHQRVQDHGVPYRYVRYREAHLLDPAGVLVAQSVGQQGVIGVLYRSPLTLDDVDIGTVESGGADPHDDVEGTFYLRLVHLLYLEAVLWDALVVVVQSRRFHSVASYFWMPYGVIGGAAYSTAAPLELKFKLRDGSGRYLREGARRG